MLSSNPALFVFLGVFAVGALFFALGSYLIRVQQREAPSGVAPSAPEVPLELRLDYVERLAIVGASWCIDELESLRASDADARVRDAAEAAIIVIRSRGY